MDALREEKSGHWRDFIEKTPQVLHGKPRLKGTRIPVSLIIAYLAAGKSGDYIQGEFPGLTKQQIDACRDYDRDPSKFGTAT